MLIASAVFMIIAVVTACLHFYGLTFGAIALAQAVFFTSVLLSVVSAYLHFAHDEFIDQNPKHSV